MTSRTPFRPYAAADREACISIFDANCPEFFAPNEREDYMAFLAALPNCYQICEVAGRVVAAFGLMDDDSKAPSLNRIMIDPKSQGAGIGGNIMKHVISAGGASQASLIKIAASHKSAPFFARFGAVAMTHIKDGWGAGMDRVDMELHL